MARLTSTLVSEVMGEVAITKEDKLHIEIAIAKLLLKMVNYQQFSKIVSPYMTTASKKAMRNKVLNKFELIVSLKNALIEILRNNVTEPLDRKAIFKKWGVGDHSILLDGFKNERCITLAIKKAKSCEIDFVDSEDVRKRCGAMILAIEPAIISFVRYKLTFILKSNNMPASVIVSELVEKCVLTYYAESPFKPESHLINTLKRSFRNKGLHLIKYYTANKRRRLNNDGEHNFSNTCISLDHILEKNGGGENHGIYNNKSDGVSFEDLSNYDYSEISMSWDSIVSQHGKNPVKMKILNLIALRSDSAFIQFVKHKYPRRIRSNHDVEDIYDRLGRKDYMKTVREFVGAKKKPFYEFLHYVHDSVGGGA